MKLKLAFGAVMVAATVVLSGCVVFLGPVTSSQQDVIGKLRLTFTICASGFNDGDDPDPENEDHPGCPDQGLRDSDANNDTVQVLLGFRVPAGTGTPDTLTTDPVPSPPAGGPTSFARSPSYAADLQRHLPAPRGSCGSGTSRPRTYTTTVRTTCRRSRRSSPPTSSCRDPRTAGPSPGPSGSGPWSVSVATRRPTSCSRGRSAAATSPSAANSPRASTRRARPPFPPTCSSPRVTSAFSAAPRRPARDRRSSCPSTPI